MDTRWTADQVLSLASDASSQIAARGVSTPAHWSGTGTYKSLVWGRCRGSGSTPYQTVVDLGDPAFRCTCPSRKSPCKHALGLLLLWAAGGVPAGAEPADFAAVWAESREGRAAAATKPHVDDNRRQRQSGHDSDHQQDYSHRRTQIHVAGWPGTNVVIAAIQSAIPEKT